MCIEAAWGTGSRNEEHRQMYSDQDLIKRPPSPGHADCRAAELLAQIENNLHYVPPCEAYICHDTSC